MSSRNQGGGYRCLCPACGGRMRIKDSDVKTPTVKTMYAQCTTFGCSASYVGTLSWDFELAPSGLDHPMASLPAAPSVERAKLIASERNRGSSQMDILQAAGC